MTLYFTFIALLYDSRDALIRLSNLQVFIFASYQETMLILACMWDLS